MAVSRFALPADPLFAARVCLEQRMPAGDPVRLRSASRQAAATAAELRRITVVLQSSSVAGLWSGAAHDSFADQVRTHAPSMTAAAERYELYAGLLGAYAAVLDEVAPRLVATRNRLRQRSEEVSVRGFAAEVRGAGMPWTAPGPDVADLLPLAHDFKAGYDRWADALDRCLRGLRDTDPTPDRHGLRGFGHRLAGVVHRQLAPLERAVLHPSLRNLSDCLGSLNTDLSVLGVGLLFICPPAATACLVTAAVLGAARLAVDADRRARGEQVSYAGLGMELAAAIPVGGGGVRALRVADDVVHLVPGGGLLAHEGVEGGHTLAKHVGKSPAFLRHRLATEPGLSAASTFRDRDAAERAISETLHLNRSRVAEWLSTPSRSIRVTAPTAVEGSTLERDCTELTEVSRVIVVLRRHNGFPGGYRIHTAWPAP